jgi:hypothetical protein
MDQATGQHASHEGEGPGAAAAPAAGKEPWQEPKLAFVEPTLIQHGKLEEVTAGRVFQADGLCGYGHSDVYYLTAGTVWWHLHLRQRWGEPWLAPGFAEIPARLRRSFWGLGVFKLLRPLGLYSLHAAGVVSTTGAGILMVGGSGSGKLTLALDLLGRGWGYLSDDAIMLRMRTATVEALACRRDAYIDTDEAVRYAEFP